MTNTHYANQDVLLVARFFNASGTAIVPDPLPVISVERHTIAGSVLLVDAVATTQLADSTLPTFGYVFPAATNTVVGELEYWFYSSDALLAGYTQLNTRRDSISIVDSTWIAQIADILADTSALLPGTTPARFTPYDPSTLTVGIIFGADYTSASTLGRLEIPSTVPNFDLTTDATTLTFQVRLKDDIAGSEEVFTAPTVTVKDADEAYVTLTATQTRMLQPGMACIWSLFDTDGAGLETPLNGGRYTISDSVPPA